MPTYTNINGVWRNVANPAVNVNGVWRYTVKNAVNIDGVWKWIDPALSQTDVETVRIHWGIWGSGSFEKSMSGNQLTVVWRPNAIGDTMNIDARIGTQVYNISSPWYAIKKTGYGVNSSASGSGYSLTNTRAWDNTQFGATLYFSWSGASQNGNSSWWDNIIYSGTRSYTFNTGGDYAAKWTDCNFPFRASSWTNYIYLRLDQITIAGVAKPFIITHS